MTEDYMSMDEILRKLRRAKENGSLSEKLECQALIYIIRELSRIEKMIGKVARIE